MKKSIKPLEELLDSVRDIEGFPIGKDEDIMALSDPPYYTACPNPYINDFIEEHGTLYNEETDDYNCTPFLADIIEGKGDPIYNLHTYHTKVPPKAIMAKILHYTKPGDIVFDGFCGTGMTGIAATLCGDSDRVRKITGETSLKPKNVGIRYSILSDLSPAAAFIASNYNLKNALKKFELRAYEILKEVNDECLWMFKTHHIEDKKIIGEGIINFSVWSDVFICPYCNGKNVFWDIGVDKEQMRNTDSIVCNNCNADLTNIKMERQFSNDGVAIQRPVLINYSFAGKTYKKIPDSNDIDLINKINRLDIPYWYPDEEIPIGDKLLSIINSHGIKRISSLFTTRNLYSTACLFDKIIKSDPNIRSLLIFWLTSILIGQTKLNRYFEASYSQVNRYLKGTYYIGKKTAEVNFNYSLIGKLKKIAKHLAYTTSNTIINTGSSTAFSIKKNSVDYIFVDPPFGSNLMYSELNFIWESWLRLITNNNQEAIVNKAQSKSMDDYSELMENCFKVFYRILKPKRWMTVEFHNSKSEVWNKIQRSIIKAGFVIANVSILNKGVDTFNQMNATGAVKNDLVISAYKPTQFFENHFLSMAGEGLEQEFIKMHLSYLKAEPTIERTEQMLYSKLLAYYVQRSYAVKYDASTFYKMLRSNFVEENGYWFNKGQIGNYREYKQKMELEGIDDLKSGQMTILIDCEKTAIIWLHTFLDTPQDFQTIHPAFTKIASMSNDSVPELTELLDKNFIAENGKYRRPQTEDEKLSVTQKRERELRREFDVLLLEAKGSKKKIKGCRKQAIIYGFEQCYKHNRFQDILDLGKRLDKKIIENDSEISEFIEVAELKVEGF